VLLSICVVGAAAPLQIRDRARAKRKRCMLLTTSKGAGIFRVGSPSLEREWKRTGCGPRPRLASRPSATTSRHDPDAGVEPDTVVSHVQGECLAQTLNRARSGGGIQPFQYYVGAREA